MSLDSRQPLDSTLSILAQVTGMQVRTEEGAIIITGKPCH
jgi:hypothetical protein